MIADSLRKIALAVILVVNFSTVFNKILAFCLKEAKKENKVPT